MCHSNKRCRNKTDSRQGFNLNLKQLFNFFQKSSKKTGLAAIYTNVASIFYTTLLDAKLLFQQRTACDRLGLPAVFCFCFPTRRWPALILAAPAAQPPIWRLSDEIPEAPPIPPTDPGAAASVYRAADSDSNYKQAGELCPQVLRM